MFFSLCKGWEQGVIGMKKGGKRLIAIPSALAYGEKVKDTNSKINYCLKMSIHARDTGKRGFMQE